MLLSVVVPVLNERPALVGLLREIEVACERLADDWEVIFVDDGSSDGSRELLEGLSVDSERVAVLAFPSNRGKADALNVGLSASRGEVVVTLDGDGQDDPASIAFLLEALKQGYDHVSGWRTPRYGPRRRAWASRIFNKATSRMTGLSLHDFNSGAKAYRGDCAHSLAIHGDLHRFIPALAAQLGWRVGETRVIHREREHGSSKYGAERYARAALDLIGVAAVGRYGCRAPRVLRRIALAAGALAIGLVVLLLFIEIAVADISESPVVIVGALTVLCSIQLFAMGAAVELFLAACRRRPAPVVVDDIAAARTAMSRAARVSEPTARE